MQPATGQPGQEFVSRPFNGREFRNTLGSFATGVTVVTSHGEDHGYGMTATAFSSVSLDPPLVLVCVITGTEGCVTIERNGVFAINVLADSQEHYSRYFAAKDRPRGRDAFAQIPHTQMVTGAPILDGVAAYLDCRLAAQHAVGDHQIFIGEVLALGVNPDVQPLLFHGGRYRYLRTDE